MKIGPNYVDTCGNCSVPISVHKSSTLYDDHAERHFCDRQCFREWADDKGAEKVLAFYGRMNVTEVIY